MECVAVNVFELSRGVGGSVLFQRFGGVEEAQMLSLLA